MANPLTYKWALQIQHQPSAMADVRVRQVAFGDGYEQVAEDGINSRRIAYPLQHIGTPETVNEIHNFLLDGVLTAFYFTPPHGKIGLYRVVKDSVAQQPISRRVSMVSATVKQCFGTGARMA